MADKNLIDGAALIGASKKFNNWGAMVTPGLVEMDKQIAAVSRNRKAAINQRTATYINNLNSEMDVTQLDPSQQSAVKNYLVQQKNIYADTANRLARTEPTDPTYMEMVDQINGIQSSFTNLAAELKTYKQDKLNYIKDFDNGTLSDGNEIGTLNNASKLYTNEGQMGIGQGGTLKFYNDEKGEFVSYRQSKKPFLKDFNTADGILKMNENAYNSGQVLTGARKNMMRNNLAQQIDKGGRDTLLSLASDDFLIQGGLNLQDPSLFEIENEEMLRDVVIDSYMDAFVDSSIQGANEKRPSSRSQSGGYSGAVQDEINATSGFAQQALDASSTTAGNPFEIVRMANSMNSTSASPKYIDRAAFYQMYLDGEDVKDSKESKKAFNDTYGNFNVFRLNSSDPSYSNGVNVDTSNPQDVYRFYIENSGMGKKTRIHYINSYSTGGSQENNTSDTNTGSLDNL